MKAKHTPGPWTIAVPYAGFSAIHAGRKVVFAIAWNDTDPEYIPKKEVEANARLIAAAPDLLAACKLGIEALTEAIAALRVNGAAKPGSTYEALKKDQEALRLAIAKATIVE